MEVHPLHPLHPSVDERVSAGEREETAKVERVERVDPLWDRKQCAKYLGITHQTLARWRRAGYGPPFLKLGGALRYVPAQVVKWAGEQAGKHVERP